jgi:hypothetical protein
MEFCFLLADASNVPGESFNHLACQWLRPDPKLKGLTPGSRGKIREIKNDES